MVGQYLCDLYVTCLFPVPYVRFGSMRYILLLCLKEGTGHILYTFYGILYVLL